MSLASELRAVWADAFKRYLLLGLLLFGVAILAYNASRLELTATHPGAAGEAAALNTTLTLPVLGTVDAGASSLPVLAVILGLVDGFNPCAMWVLVYLISVIIALNDRRRIWILVGSFVLASGVLYFLFMTAWLNIFLVVGYVRWVQLLVGLGAVWIGANNLRDYVSKGALECDVGDAASKRSTVRRIDKVVNAPLGAATILAIIGLAFVVNSIEFVCSSAIPAVFTHVLAQHQLATWQYYAYILLYDAFFMLDDLLIFGLAAFAVSTAVGEKYAKLCKLVGGIVLLALALILLFFPSLLR